MTAGKVSGPQQRLAASSDPLVARKCCRDTVRTELCNPPRRRVTSHHAAPAGSGTSIAHNLDLTLTDGLALAQHYHRDPNKDKKVGTWLSKLKIIKQFTKTISA